MLKLQKCFAYLSLFLGLQLGLVAQTVQTPKSSFPTLTPERPYQGQLTRQQESWGRQVFQITIPPLTSLLQVKVLRADLDIDLFLSDNPRLQDLTEAEIYSNEDVWNEELYVRPLQDGELSPGIWFLYVTGHSPRNSADGSQGAFTLELRMINLETTMQNISPGKSTVLDLQRNTGMIAPFSFTLPQGGTFRLDLLDAENDLDIVLNLQHFPSSISSAAYQSLSLRARESLVVPNAPGGLYKGVIIGAPVDEHPERVRLILTLGGNPPSLLLPPRPLSPGEYESDEILNRVMAATVELSTPGGTGSGLIIHSRGLILTNYHVIANELQEPSPEVVVAITETMGRTPVEGWIGKVILGDKDRDIALVMIQTDLWNRPLSPDQVWPAVPLEEGRLLSPGKALTVIGYPAIGGSGSRTSLSLSRGIVAGWEKTWFGMVIKTDAEINGGNSGGPVIAEDGRVIGLATSALQDAGGSLGFIHPINLIPAEWWGVIKNPQSQGRH